MAAFRDRTEAGQRLAKELMTYAGDPNVIVLGLPRGGVVVAYEAAKALEAPLDVYLVRKLGVPGHEELAMGAIASGGVRVLNPSVVRTTGIDDDELEAVTAREQEELERRQQTYRGDQPPPDLQGRTVILVDDGLATGATMRAAVQAVRSQEPERLVVAVPTAPPETCAEFEEEADEFVCLVTPSPFFGVGGSYDNFRQTTDDEVRQFLRQAAEALPQELLPREQEEEKE
jgi:predicted phosphoribosyltransferase